MNTKNGMSIQRRCLRAAREINPGEIISREMIDVLRPASRGAIPPYEIPDLIGLKALEPIAPGQELRGRNLALPDPS